MTIFGFFGYGGHSHLAEAFREEMLLDADLILKTSHEYPNADVKYSVNTIHDFIDSVDVVILPARFKIEPAKSVNRLALAWSRKKPCIVAPLDAYLRYVVHMENAIVCSEHSEWLDAMRMLRDDPALRSRLAENGYKTVMANLDTRNQVHKLMHALKEAQAVVPWSSTDFLQVIIPHYQERTDYLRWAATSALQANGPKREVLVVSSAKTDPTPALQDLLNEYKGTFRLFHNKQRLSFSEANNVGVIMAKDEATHYLLLNDDTVVGENALSGFYGEHLKKPDAIINPYSNCDKGWLHNDSLQIVGDQETIDLVPNMTIEQLGNQYDNLRMFHMKHSEPTLIKAPFCAFYSTFIPRKVMDTVGYLNTKFLNGGEDADFCHRAQRFGFETYWTKKAWVYHFGGKSRLFAEAQNHATFHEEDQYNNSLLHRRWARGQKKRIGIWTGPAWEKWDCESYLNGGIGGSEYCAGRLAETAASLGHSVCLYGDPATSKIQGDVEVIPWQEFKPEQEYFDLFISSRNLAPIDGRLRAKVILAWVHDIWISQNPEISEYHKSRVNKFISLSPWHRQFFNEHHKVPLEKIDIIPNGVNVEFFPKTWEEAVANKQQTRLHYSSSPDRGLDTIIYLLPFIKDKIPDISLNIFYGFHNWVKAAQSRGNQEELRQISEMERQIASLGDSVVFHGRVSQQQLAQEWLKAGVWFYPTAFTETFAITAKEAQLSATPIVCSNIAALETTVGDYGIRVKPHPFTREARIEYVDHIIRLCSDTKSWNASSRQSYKAQTERLSWPERWQDYWSKYLF